VSKTDPVHLFAAPIQWAGLTRILLGKHRQRAKGSPLRALPCEETIDESEFVEVLNYEKATSIIEAANKCAMGICSCRHEKLHLGRKKRDVPLRTCSTFGGATD
jgi:hypothetical protein